jgi:alkyldihydroxyacetonephosphate synthase
VTEPTPPIELTGTDERFGPATVSLTDTDVENLRAICTTVTDVVAVAEASRDWWPLALHWSLAGSVPRRAGAVCSPRSVDEVAAVVSWANERRVPVTVAGGRSGVCGASVPVFGGIVLDITSMAGVVAVDEASGVVEVLPGTFGPDLEAALEPNGLTVGHFPQSFEISTVGGWIACRGAGQYSTRYGKIEDMVVGLEVVLADGSVIRTGGAPRAAAGPDLTHVIMGSEGTLGVITRAWLRAHPRPTEQRRSVWWFASFDDGVEACRHIIRRGATPAVLRLYDAAESARGHGGDGQRCVLLVLDEADNAILDATMSIVENECTAHRGEPGDIALVDAWMGHRNDTSALQALTRRGFVVDTMEIAAPWSQLSTIVRAAQSALLAVPTARSATCHLSHSYLDGACLYFTFAATPPADAVESTYRALWDAGTRAVLAAGGNLSHHHGIGLNRSRFTAEALGPAHQVLVAVKAALDPKGILNPGKLGIASHFGDDPYDALTSDASARS